MKNPGLGNLNIINRAFESCYLGARSTDVYFLNIINENDVNYSRYIFFYINYLIEQNRYQEINELVDQIDILDANLLILQSKKWINENNFSNFTNIFSVKVKMIF